MDDRTRGLLAKLFFEHRRRLLNYFRRRLRNEADALDLVQEAYSRLLNVPDPDAIRTPVAYLFTIAKNLLKEYRYREHREVTVADFDERTAHDLLGTLPSLESEIEGEQLLLLLITAIDHLPPKIRTAMILKYRHGLRYQAIADAMSVSTSMVKKYLAMGIALCRLGVEQG